VLQDSVTHCFNCASNKKDALELMKSLAFWLMRWKVSSSPLRTADAKSLYLKKRESTARDEERGR
jgi:hypothetical protein